MLIRVGFRRVANQCASGGTGADSRLSCRVVKKANMDISKLGIGGTSAEAKEAASVAAWKKIVARYHEPAVWRGIWQVVNTLVPYAALWYLMYLSSRLSYWLALPLALLAGAFMVRVFIIF